jgi:hypothetical protein
MIWTKSHIPECGHDWSKWQDLEAATKFEQRGFGAGLQTTCWEEKILYQTRRCTRCNLMDKIKILARTLPE